jgi:hypothetical protein
MSTEKYLLPHEKKRLAEAKIVWTPDQLKSMGNASAKLNAFLKKTFSAGKIRIKWSQRRGGIAIFVKNKMEGPTFDSEDDAKEYLKKLGIRV